MHSLDWLRHQCHAPTIPVLPSMPTMRLDSDDAVEPALAALVAYFGEDPSRKAVKVVITGTPAGYFERRDVYALVPARTRGTSPGTYSPMAGFSTGYEQLWLHCPIEGCEQRVFAFALDVGQKVYCDLHPDTEMDYDS